MNVDFSKKKELKKGWFEKKQDWQNKMLKKYKLGLEDIELVKKNNIECKHYRCNSCNGLELLGFIDMYEQNCRECGTKRVVETLKVKNEKVEKETFSNLDNRTFDTYKEIAEAIGKSEVTVKRMAKDGKVVKLDNGKYKLQ